MKRKHDDPDGDAAMADAETSFESLGLDPRLLQGVAKLGFANPTLVQAKAIPLALEGKDILGMLCVRWEGGGRLGGSALTR
jgi:ATP-dependent RNA helicase DDX56/DBP9